MGVAMGLAKHIDAERAGVSLQTKDKILLSFIGVGVIFAALGMGEAVYRLLFLEFEGATDRLPIEMMFGLAFAWLATNVVKRIYQHRKETSERLRLIRERNYKIRHAVEAISPAPYPGNQQAIRVIREEVERIEWALAELSPR